MRRAAKVDLAQAEIVEELRRLGYRVEVIGRPVDLLVGLDYSSGTRWRILEVKTPTKTGQRRKRKDQEKQDRFIAETGTPIVISLEQALEALRGL